MRVDSIIVPGLYLVVVEIKFDSNQMLRGWRFEDNEIVAGPMRSGPHVVDLKTSKPRAEEIARIAPNCRIA